MTTKLRVNLFSESLLPPKLRLSFARLCQGILGLFVLMLVINIISYVRVSNLVDQKNALSLVKQEKTQTKDRLEQQVFNKKASANLVAEVEMLSQQIELKHRLLGELGNLEQMTSFGYSSLLTDLATVATDKVWLQRIHVSDGRFEFDGFSREPANIPVWVERLKHVETLKGQSFSTLTMNRGEDKPLAFTLRSRIDKEASK